MGIADKAARFRSFGASIVLFFSLALFYRERWIAGLILLVVFFVLLIVKAPSGGTCGEDDSNLAPKDD